MAHHQMLPPTSYTTNEDILDLLVRNLRDGSLALFVGAGVSMSATPLSDDKEERKAKFPSWIELVEKISKKTNVNFDVDKGKNSNNYLIKKADKIKKAAIDSKIISDDSGGVENAEYNSFAEMIKEYLYEDILYSTEILSLKLLIALGSLVMGSTRGSTSIIVNYNFDDLLEWYLKFYGYSIQIVSKLPYLHNRCDATIFHPHGFLPHGEINGTFQNGNIVFGETDYLERIGDSSNPWNQIQEYIMANYFCLFVGMSGEDMLLKKLAHNTFKINKRSRPVGISYIKMNSEQSEEAKQETSDNLLKWGIVPRFYENHTDLPECLLDICRNAAQVN